MVKVMILSALMSSSHVIKSISTVTDRRWVVVSLTRMKSTPKHTSRITTRKLNKLFITSLTTFRIPWLGPWCISPGHVRSCSVRIPSAPTRCSTEIQSISHLPASNAPAGSESPVSLRHRLSCCHSWLEIRQHYADCCEYHLDWHEYHHLCYLSFCFLENFWVVIYIYCLSVSSNYIYYLYIPSFAFENI